VADRRSDGPRDLEPRLDEPRDRPSQVPSTSQGVRRVAGGAREASRRGPPSHGSCAGDRLRSPDAPRGRRQGRSRPPWRPQVSW
jgi:hypothetical protein